MGALDGMAVQLRLTAPAPTVDLMDEAAATYDRIAARRDQNRVDFEVNDRLLAAAQERALAQWDQEKRRRRDTAQLHELFD